MKTWKADVEVTLRHTFDDLTVKANTEQEAEKLLKEKAEEMAVENLTEMTNVGSWDYDVLF